MIKRLSDLPQRFGRWIPLVALLLIATWLRVYRLVELPPGLHYDEAANGLLAGDIAFRGYRPIFITSYTGKEPLFFYIAGGIMRLAGQSIFTLRLASVYSGVLTIAGAYWLGCEIGRLFQQKAYHWVGLLSAAILTTHFAHILFSRLGFRAITQPLLQTLFVATLLYALRAQKRHVWLIAGVLLGLGAYTYLAVRLFPALLGIVFLVLLRRSWRGLLTLSVSASLTAAPLLYFFYRFPDTFWVRISQVSGDIGFSDYAQSYIKTLQILLGLNGDPYMRFNIPFQPWFDTVTTILFILGWLLLLTQIVRQQSAEQLAVRLLLLLAPLVMILPSALALGEIVPSNLRVIGVLPFVAYPAALFVVSLIEWRPAIKQAAAPALIGIFLIGLLWSGQQFFGRWGSRIDNFYESDADMIAVSQYIDTLDVGTTALFVGSQHYQHPTVAFASDRYDDVRWLVESDALVTSAEQSVIVVYPNKSPAPDFLRAQDRWQLAAPTSVDGSTQFEAYQIPAGADSTRLLSRVESLDSHPLHANFGNVIELVDVLSPAQIDSSTRGQNSQPLDVYLKWRVLNRPDRSWTPFVHVVDRFGVRWAQQEFSPYPAEQWRSGDIILQRATLDKVPGMPSAEYSIVVGLFDGSDRLTLVDDAGRFAGAQAQTDNIFLPGSSEQPSRIALGVEPRLVLDGLRLVESSVAADSAESGTRLPLTLTWHATHSQPNRAAQLSLIDASGNTVDSFDYSPGHGHYPFELWSAETWVEDLVDWTLPLDVASGDYRIELAIDGQRVTLAETLTIVQTERTYILPAVETTLDVQFGSDIALPGYSLIAQADPNTWELTLVWQALRNLDADYTLFIHVLNPDGTCCIWQVDAMPRQFTYPTSRWLANEVVDDRYTIQFDAADGVTYPLEIGLYLPTTGQRLLVTESGITESDHLFLRPIEQ